MQLELPSPSGHVQTQLQRSTELVAFGLRSGELLQSGSLDIPDSFGQVVSASDKALDFDSVRVEFRRWVLANGFRDCVEAIGETLEWLRKTCFIWSKTISATSADSGTTSLQAQMTGEDWNTHIVAGAVKFNRLSLPDKLEHLESTYGWRRPDLTSEVLSLNAARNCLVHRAGIVGPKDVKEPDSGLSVTWRRMYISAGEGEARRELFSGSRVEAGESVAIEFIEVAKQYAIGDKLTFTAGEFVEITLTFLLFSKELEESLQIYQQECVAKAQGLLT